MSAGVAPRPDGRRGAGTETETGTQVSEILALAATALFACAIATFLSAQLVSDQPMPDNVTLVMWYAIRVSGILAYLTLWLTTVSGMCVSAGFFPKLGAIFMPVHQLADLALSLALLHAALLLGDRYAGFTPSSLVVPFTSTYEPLWTGFGILALYLGAVLFWSVDVRPKIGYARWRALHYLAFVVYLLALTHGLFAGTDRETFPLRVIYWATGGAVVVLAGMRIRKRSQKPESKEAVVKHATAQSPARG